MKPTDNSKLNLLAELIARIKSDRAFNIDRLQKHIAEDASEEAKYNRGRRTLDRNIKPSNQ